MLSFLRVRPVASLFIIALLAALNGAAYFYVLYPEPRVLSVTFLDVDQGDAILVEGPTGVQLLVDGGRDRAVLRELASVLGPFDRTLDAVLATHPDADHIGGLADVFDRYRIGHFLEPGIERDTSQARRLESKMDGERGLERFVVRRGMRLHLGGGAYADVLYPDHDVVTGDTNAGSVAIRIVYGATEFMLTGDLPSAAEEYLARLAIAGELRSDVLKAGHHGSRTSTSETFLAKVEPDYFVVSAGKDNRYGHPHEEVVARARAVGARILSTAEDGTVAFISDGIALRVR